MVPTNQIHVVVKQIGINLLFCVIDAGGKNYIYPVKVSTPIWSHNEYWNRGKKTRQKFRSFFVSWENAESSFEDSVVKKIIKNITYTDKIAVVKLHTKLKVISDFYLYLEGCNTYIHWVDKNALGIGALSVRCTALELPHVFPLKSLD